MRSVTRISLMTSVLLGLAAVASAESGAARAGASGEATAQSAVERSQASAHSRADARASADAQVDEAALQTIRGKVADASKKARKARRSANAKLERTAQGVDARAQLDRDDQVASRIAAEFETTAESILEEKHGHDVSWGELTIARTLLANSAMEIGLEEVFQLRSEGMGWGEIAAGMGFRLGDVVSAAKAEARVASGIAKADGRIARISGEGARAGLAAGANASAHAGNSQVGATAGVNARGGVTLPAPRIKP